MFMFHLDFYAKANQHRIIESLLEVEKKQINVEENININEEDISF